MITHSALKDFQKKYETDYVNFELSQELLPSRTKYDTKILYHNLNKNKQSYKE